MNVYDLWHVNGDVYEIEADFYEREGDNWVFCRSGDEVFRISWFDVVSVGKSTVRPRPVESTDEEHQRLWL
jgi:hypothetical protein